MRALFYDNSKCTQIPDRTNLFLSLVALVSKIVEMQRRILTSENNG